MDIWGVFFYFSCGYSCPVEEAEKDLLNRAMADIVKGARNTEGMTQRELADAAGVGYETFKNIERAQHKISVLQIVQIAGALHIPAKEFVDRAMTRYEQLLVRSGMSAGSTTSSTNEENEDPRGMDAGKLDQLRQSDVALAAHPKTEESEQDEQYD